MLTLARKHRRHPELVRLLPYVSLYVAGKKRLEQLPPSVRPLVNELRLEPAMNPRKRRTRKVKYASRRKARRSHGGVTKALPLVAAIGISYWLYWWLEKKKTPAFAGLGRTRSKKKTANPCSGQWWKPGQEHTDFAAFMNWVREAVGNGSLRVHVVGDHINVVGVTYSPWYDLTMISQKAAACGTLRQEDADWIASAAGVVPQPVAQIARQYGPANPMMTTSLGPVGPFSVQEMLTQMSMQPVVSDVFATV